MSPGPGGGLDVLAAAYENDRPEVRALVPAGADRVLDVGCSSGALGAALKADGAGTVVGLEVDPGYVAIARERLDVVHRVDLDGDLALDEDPFDVIVCADVLEHLRDPHEVLRRLGRLLAPGGTVVVSLPNVRYWETFWQLGVKGTFPRRSMGIFDRTHLRWFTLHDAYVLLQEAGLEVVEVRRILRPRPTGPSDGRLVRLLARGPGRTFLTYQHVLAARRPAP